MPRVDVPAVKTASLAPTPLHLTPILLESKNEALTELARLVRKYNLPFRTLVLQTQAGVVDALGPAGVQLLDKMSLRALGYLATKPPAARKARGSQKWYDMRDFAAQLVAHASFFNIKLLCGFGDDDDFNYWFERLDEKTNALNQAHHFSLWMQKKEKEVFAGGSPRGLLYLDDLQREPYRVEDSGGRVRYADDRTILDTSDGFATASDRFGVYIYVCSAITHKVYTFDGRYGVMHHSSFLKGQPVVSAGDWLVQQGEVRFVNGASGHYRPTAENVRAFGRLCSAFWSARTIVKPWNDREVYFSMKNFILLGEAAPPLPLNVDPVMDVKSLMKKDVPAKTDLRHRAPPPPPPIPRDKSYVVE